MKRSGVAWCVAFLASIFLLLSSQGALAQFNPGDCVTLNEVPSHVVGPSAVQGLIMVQGDKPGATPMGVRPDALKSAACPGPVVQKAACFPSDPDSNGASDLEIAVRGAIRGEEARTNEHLTVKFRSVRVGEPRAWTAQEQIDFGDGDITKAILVAQADYVTCEEDTDTVTQVERQREFRCFVSSLGDTLLCETFTALAPDQQIETVSKY